jgi:hypothetical protein
VPPIVIVLAVCQVAAVAALPEILIFQLPLAPPPVRVGAYELKLEELR